MVRKDKKNTKNQPKKIVCVIVVNFGSTKLTKKKKILET